MTVFPLFPVNTAIHTIFLLFSHFIVLSLSAAVNGKALWFMTWSLQFFFMFQLLSRVSSVL